MKDSKQSRFREKMIELKFLSELFEKCWLNEQFDIEASIPLIDNSGYDLIISNKTSTHFLQLKSKKKNGGGHKFKVHEKLFSKPNPGILLIEFDEVDKRNIILNYQYLSLNPIDPKQLKVATHTKPNAEGIKMERPDFRIIKTNSCENISLKNLIEIFSKE